MCQESRTRAVGDMGREPKDKNGLLWIFLALWLYQKLATRTRAELKSDPMPETRLPFGQIHTSCLFVRLVETSILPCQKSECVAIFELFLKPQFEYPR